MVVLLHISPVVTTVVGGAFFGEGAGQVFAFEPQCSEEGQCIVQTRALMPIQCGHQRDVGLFCQGKGGGGGAGLTVVG